MKPKITHQNRLLSAIALIIMGAFLILTGCDNQDGPAEKAGEKIDQTVEQVGDSVGNAMEEAGDAVKDATN